MINATAVRVRSCGHGGIIDCDNCGDEVAYEECMAITSTDGDDAMYVCSKPECREYALDQVAYFQQVTKVAC